MCWGTLEQSIVNTFFITHDTQWQSEPFRMQIIHQHTPTTVYYLLSNNFVPCTYHTHKNDQKQSKHTYSVLCQCHRYYYKGVIVS